MRQVFSCDLNFSRAASVLLWGFAFASTMSLAGESRESPVQIFVSGINASSIGNSTEKIAYQVISEEGASAAKDFVNCVLIHGYVVSPKRLNKVIGGAFPEMAFKSFAEAYFGKELISMLASSHCERVVVVMQEAIGTTTLEMVERTEEFAKFIGCSELKPCALYGHSKGGLVVTTMARRCMQEISRAGEVTCRGLAKFYSSSGNNLGAVYGALLYGLYATDPFHPKLIEFERKARLSGIDVTMTGPEAMDYVPGKSNPIWVDISPIAPMEHGVPLAVANGVQLNHGGWLVGDYAAADSDAQWGGGEKPPTGCGAWTDFLARLSCALTGRSTAAMHDESLKPLLEFGLDLWRGDSRFSSAAFPDYLSALSWETNQQGDGMADYFGSLGVCHLGGSAVARCSSLGSVNHAGAAGSGPAVRRDLGEFLSQRK